MPLTQAACETVIRAPQCVFDHVPDPAGLRRHAGEVFDLVAAGRLTSRIGARYPLADAAMAHADLASRRTVGRLLLLP